MKIRLFLAFLVVLVAIACNDGKFNLVLYVPDWRDSEEEEYEIKYSSHNVPPGSSIAEVSSSSYLTGQEPPQSSSSVSREGGRSSTAKVNKDGLVYDDYPMLEIGAAGVEKGWASRYWDGCKPHCSGLEHIGNPKPWAICKICDKSGVNEISNYEKMEDSWNPPWFVGYNGVKSSCEPPGGAAYTCFDMAPYAVNDTLAYGFVARNKSVAKCGACYLLEFDGGWHDKPEMPRPTHRAVAGKRMIVMVSNTGGVDVDQFDIMIPGGGVGDFQTGLPNQIGMAKEELGVVFGGLLSNCLGGDDGKGGILREWGIRDGSHRATLEEWQRCLRQECNRAFGNKDSKLLNGCLWHVDWFMATDNPTLSFKEVKCPQYLIDKYRSSIDTEPPPFTDEELNSNVCLIQGEGCKEKGWYD